MQKISSMLSVCRADKSTLQVLTWLSCGESHPIFFMEKATRFFLHGEKFLAYWDKRKIRTKLWNCCNISYKIMKLLQHIVHTYETVAAHRTKLWNRCNISWHSCIVGIVCQAVLHRGNNIRRSGSKINCMLYEFNFDRKMNPVQLY